MKENFSPPSDDMISERDLLIASFITAIALAAFTIGCRVGRDIGSMLFN